MAYFEVICWVISSSINLFYLKNGSIDNYFALFPYSIQVESWVRMACDHIVPLSNEDLIKIDQNVNDDSALITGLEPFSKYTFGVHQNSISHSLDVVTLSERPQTRPNEGKKK